MKTEDVKRIEDSLDHIGTSIGGSLTNIARSITPLSARPLNTPDGGQISTLTEAVIFMASNLLEIAKAIGNLADAIREKHGE